MFEKMTIGEICNRSTVFTYKSMSVSEAARLMLEQHVGSLVVIEESDAGRKIVGMLTDRDIVVSVVARDLNAQTVRVADIMSSNLATCETENSIPDVLNLMRRNGVRRIPVTDAQGNLVGIIALDDMLEIISEQLQNFVHIIASERKHEVRVHG